MIIAYCMTKREDLNESLSISDEDVEEEELPVRDALELSELGEIAPGWDF